MFLKMFEKGTSFDILTEMSALKDDQSFDTSQVLHASLQSAENDLTFVVESRELYKLFSLLKPDARMRFSVKRGAVVYSFYAKPLAAARKDNFSFVKFAQDSEITETSLREHERHEISVIVKLYALPEGFLRMSDFKSLSKSLEFQGKAFDISAGGLCIVSNEKLVSASEPFFLADFKLAYGEPFLLPAKLVRKGDCPQTAAYKYDYGFMFIYDGLPSERKRLITELFNVKLDIFKSRR